MRRWIPLLLLLALSLLSACSDDGGGPSVTDSSDAATSDAEGASDTGSAADSALADTASAPDSATPDTAAPDAAPDAPEDTTAPTCDEDDLGGATRAAATPLTMSTELTAARVCDGGEDWFRLEVSPGDRIAAAVTRSDEQALTGATLRIYDETGIDVLELATAGDGRLLLTWLSDRAGAVHLRVTPPDGADLEYDLSLLLERADTPDPCDDSFEEPNDSRDAAWLVSEPATWSAEGVVCEDDTDWFAFELSAGETLTIRLEFTHEEGDLDVALYAGDDPEPLQTSESAADEERVQAGPFEEARTLHLEVYGWRGETNRYTITSTVFGPPELEGQETGQVLYEDRPYDETGLLEPVERPLPSGQIEIVRERDGAVVATGLTDAEGRFDVRYGAHEGERYQVRALAAIEVASVEEGSDTRWRSRVVDRTPARALYALVTDPFEPARPDPEPWTLRAGVEAGVAGAMNVADVTRVGFEFVRQYSDRPAPELTTRWQSGLAFDCGSCFSEDTISLGGQLEDTDEFDDHIILHEFGHYVVRWFSQDDSPGGSHRDRQVSPRLAYGEGVAYFFCAMVLDAPQIVDTFIDDTRVIDAERVTQNGEARDDLVGTTTGDLGGNLREEIITGIMWDALDPFDEAEPFDTLEIGVEGHMELLFGAFAPEAAVGDLGPQGIDLTDWLGALYCSVPEAREALPALSEEREFPWVPEEHTDCQENKGEDAPYALRRRADGSVWLTGRRAGVSPPGVAQLRSPRSAEIACEKLPCPIVASAGPSDQVVVTGRLAGRWFGASWVGEQARARLLGGSARVRLSSMGPAREYRIK